MKTLVIVALSFALVVSTGVASANPLPEAVLLPVVPDVHDSVSVARMPSSCISALQVADKYQTDVSKLATDGSITFGRVKIRVSGSDAEFRTHDRIRRTWNYWFRSWVWLAAAAREGLVTEAVDVAAAWHVAVPDPGSEADRDTLAALGWNEGIVTKRMTVLLCLWDVSKDERLRGVIADLAEVNLDVRRYYGRPERPPHNHGAMANFALIGVGEALERQDWIEAALDRMEVDFPEVYAACGADREQSSAYMDHNHQLWQRAADKSTSSGRLRFASAIEEQLREARRGLRALTVPGGRLVRVGDGIAKDGFPVVAADSTTWWCQEGGWAAGRDSWRNPTAHYTVHFGPTPKLHGHDDHGSVTWWVDVNGPTEVLVDRGNPDKDGTTSASAWAESKAAHNVTYPEGVSFLSRSTGTRSLSAKSHRYTVSDQVQRLQLKRQRSLKIDMAVPRLTATDSVSSRDAFSWIQAWHLHPDWRRYTGNDRNVVAVHPNGSQLTVTCTAQGQDRSAVRVVPKVVNEVDYETSTPRRALAVTCSANGNNLKIVGSLQVK